MKIAVYVLYQRRELSKASCFLMQAAKFLNEDTKLYLQINDDDCPNIRNIAEKLSSHIEIRNVGKNLGVAGGRNYIIREAIANGADFLISCDTDIIFEDDYFHQISAAYEKLSKIDPDLGIVQPILINGPDVVSCFDSLDGASSWDEISAKLDKDQNIKQKFWHRIVNVLGEDAALKAVMHSGMSNIWAAHFGASISATKGDDHRLSDDILKTYRTLYPSMRSDLELLKDVINTGNPVRIGATAGGISAFHKNVFINTDGYDEIFNPFGYEDSEFGFRTNTAGYHHYLIPKCMAIHDVFVSGQNRSLQYSARIGLLRGVETGGKWLTESQRAYTLRQSMFAGLRTIVSSFSKHASLGAKQNKEAVETLPSTLASYAAEFFRGLLHAARRDETPELSSLVALFDGTEDDISDFRVGLDQNIVLRSRLVQKRGFLPLINGQVLSFHAFDCHIADISGDNELVSRHFDLTFKLMAEEGSKNYQVNIDILSDDVLAKCSFTAAFEAVGAAQNGLVQVSNFRSYFKAHEYGEFSQEDLYPSPTLYQSSDWLSMVKKQFAAIGSIRHGLQIGDVLSKVINYLDLGKPNLRSEEKIENMANPENPRAATSNAVFDPKAVKPARVLIFTDSRGQHKPRGCDHDVFAERLAKDERFDVTNVLCPMKWTTTLDFLEQFPAEKLREFDHVILYTGIVEWSPRKLSNARNDLYDSKDIANAENLRLNTRDYSKKIVNNKKCMFDSVFGELTMARHFSEPSPVIYEGEQTTNMYALQDGIQKLLPRLVAIPNLIFITANRFVPGWRGDYAKERPANISVVEEYATAFARVFPKERVIDLMEWTDSEVKMYTCDNLHLTEAGSNWIYDQIVERIEPKVMQQVQAPQIKWPDYEFSGFGAIERMNSSKIATLTKRVRRDGLPLATLIIGVRLDDRSPERVVNLRFLLNWIDFYYQDLFDVLLVEQDSSPRLDLTELGAKPYVRYEFIFNPREYNRGWGYNTAVRHFCSDAVVVALMDTDVLTGRGFVSDVMACHKDIEVCSPYLNVYYTTKEEAAQVIAKKSVEHLKDSSRIKNPVTVCGGIVIFKRSTFLALKGFEQYIGYGCEDRALDVAVFNHIDSKRIKVSPESYVHMWHPSDQVARKNFDSIFAHLKANYKCDYDPAVKPFEFIHKNCRHVSAGDTCKLMIERDRDFGEMDLYKDGRVLAVNGLVEREERNWDESQGLVFPPAFKGLEGYSVRELYENQPDPDSRDLRAFYNLYQGERCFIIGNGPSLNDHDLTLLEGEFSFGVNSFFYKTRETGYRPTFYVVEDNSVMKENIEEIRNFDAPFKFFPTLYKRLHPKTPNTFFFEMNRGFYEKSSPNYVVPRFSTDASKVLYCGQSVTYINLQLAFFMGFTEVYLIGMDFDYVIPKSHKRTGDVLLSDGDDLNHFHKDYFGAGKTWKDPKLDRVLLNYRMADLAFSGVGRKIYNATIGGRLEVFDRVDYNGLLRDPLTGKKRRERIEPPVTALGSLLRQRGDQEPSTTVAAGSALASVAGQRLAGNTQLAAQLLLNPVETLPRTEAGGDLAPTVDALLAFGGPIAEHFVKVRNWARSLNR